MFLDKVSLFCFLCSYVVAFALELTQFARRTTTARVAALCFAAAGFIAHTSYLLTRSSHHELPPLLSSTHDWTLVSAWLIIVVYLGIQFWNPQLTLGIFAIPLVLVLVCIAPFTSQTPLPQVEDMRMWGMLHASALVLSLLGTMLAGVVSLMYLIQHNRLKLKRGESPSLQLFSLERLSRINWFLIVFSVPLQTVGFATGLWMVYLSKSGKYPVDLLNSTVGISAVAWVVMAVLFGWVVQSQNVGGRLVAFRTITACLFMFVTMMVMILWAQDGIHSLNPASAAEVAE